MIKPDFDNPVIVDLGYAPFSNEVYILHFLLLVLIVFSSLPFLVLIWRKT